VWDSWREEVEIGEEVCTEVGLEIEARGEGDGKVGRLETGEYGLR
jgi:hypothetical protein